MPASAEHKQNVLRAHPDATIGKGEDGLMIVRDKPGGKILGSSRAAWVAWRDAAAKI